MKIFNPVYADSLLRMKYGRREYLEILETRVDEVLCNPLSVNLLWQGDRTRRFKNNKKGFYRHVSQKR